MRSLDSVLDRFCRKHPRFGIPNLMTVLVAGTAIVFLMDMFSGGMASGLLAFNSDAIFHHLQLWRLVTFVFVPLSNQIFSLVLSLYFYWWIGSTLEREWGTAKFNLFYLFGMLFNIILGLIMGSVSITYLNLSMFFAFATLFPDMRVLLFFIIPVKIKWLAWVDAGFFALTIVVNLVHMNWLGALVPVVAVLNYLLFFWSDIMELLGRKRTRFQHQTSAQTVNFKKATKKAQQEKGYIHKCAVCGKTDTDYPDMEFRYCSQCNGYYCYCPEHLHNHVHIQ